MGTKRKNRSSDEEICAFHGTGHRHNKWGSKHTLSAEETEMYKELLARPESTVVCQSGMDKLRYGYRNSSSASSAAASNENIENDDEETSSGIFFTCL